MTTTHSADHAEAQHVRRWVSRVTLMLLALLTVASVLNIHDMAEATHAAGGIAAWIVSIAIGGTLSVLAYVASITDGDTRRMAAGFAVFAAIVSTALQVSLFLDRGAHMAVAFAFGVGVPFFEVALALTDSMLRRYATPVPNTVPVTVQNTAQNTVANTVPDTITPPVPVTVQNTVPDSAPDTVTQHATRNTQQPVNITELARQLGVSRTTVYRRLNNGELSLNGATGD